MVIPARKTPAFSFDKAKLAAALNTIAAEDGDESSGVSLTSYAEPYSAALAGLLRHLNYDFGDIFSFNGTPIDLRRPGNTTPYLRIIPITVEDEPDEILVTIGRSAADSAWVCGTPFEPRKLVDDISATGNGVIIELIAAIVAEANVVLSAVERDIDFAIHP